MSEKEKVEKEFAEEEDEYEEAKATIDLDRADKHIIPTSVFIPKDLLKQLGYVAVEEGVSRGEIIRRAVKEYLAKRNPKKEDTYPKEAIEYREKAKKLCELIKQLKDKGYDVSVSEEDFLPENIDKSIAEVEKTLKEAED